MKILLIDSHNAEIHDETVNLHVRNSIILKNALGADLIATPKEVEAISGKVYDIIVFVHASAYVKTPVFVKFLLTQPNARYFYVLNDYYLGEPHPLWVMCRDYNVRYHVIANHSHKCSKVVSKNVDTWNIVNLNSLITEDVRCIKSMMFNLADPTIIYWGNYRSGRVKYFKKYFDPRLVVSTSKKNIDKFREYELQASWIDKLRWDRHQLCCYDAALYIEDEKTHTNYSCMANRFYEAVSHKVISFFDVSCKHTIDRSGYTIDPYFIVNDKEELHKKVLERKRDVNEKEHLQKALEEKQYTLDKIKEIITTTESTHSNIKENNFLK